MDLDLVVDSNNCVWIYQISKHPSPIELNSSRIISNSIIFGVTGRCDGDFTWPSQFWALLLMTDCKLLGAPWPEVHFVWFASCLSTHCWICGLFYIFPICWIYTFNCAISTTPANGLGSSSDNDGLISVSFWIYAY